MSNVKLKAFWIAFGDLAGRGLGFLASVYLARVLGLEYFGLVTLALAILGYANWFADLGLVNIGVREMAKAPERRVFRAKEIFHLKALLGATVLLGGILLISIIPMGPIQKQVILGFLYSIVPYSILIDWYYNGRQRFGSVAISKILTSGSYLLMVIILVHNHHDVTMVPILYTIGVITSVVFIATISIFEKPFSLPSRGIPIYKDLLIHSSLLGIGWFFTQTVTLLPPILIAALIGLKEAGIYGASFRIVIIAMMFDRIFVNLLLPNLSALWDSDKAVAKERVHMVLKLVIVGGSLLSLLIALNADTIIGLLYGFDYQDSVQILILLSVFIMLTFLNSLFAFGLIATQHDREYLIATTFGGSIAALVIFLFAALGNLNGVAFSVVLGELVLMAFAYFWFKRVIIVKVFRPLCIMAILAFLLYFSTIYFNIVPILSSVISVIVLPVAAKNLGIITNKEIHWLKEKLLT